MKQRFMQVAFALLAIYTAVCTLLFFMQEKFIFFPQKLPNDYRFRFTERFEEKHIRTKDGLLLHGLLFKVANPQKLVFYLHGNAGSLASWGEVAATYTALNCDVFLLDYRGYGKSEGEIEGQGQLFGDVQAAYDAMKQQYRENQIIVLGYSVGTGMASKLASTNNPSLLILQAPYYSLVDMMRRNYRIVPTFLLKYRLETNEYIQQCKMPVVLFHGDKDEVIPYESSLELGKLFKPEDLLITLTRQGHNGMTDNKEYRIHLSKLIDEQK